MYRYLLILLVILFNSCSAQNSFNGGFEKIESKTNKPIGWTYGFNKTQALTYPAKLDSLLKVEGKYSVSIEKKEKGEGYGVIDYVISESFKGSSIELVGYMKTEAVANGYAGLWLRLDGEDGEAIAFDNMEKRKITGNSDWKKYTIQLAYNENVNAIHLGGLLVGDGKAWFDDFELFIDGKKIKTLKPIEPKGAEKDVEFENGSNIQNFVPNAQQVSNLAVAAQFWGFLKYHHSSIANGDYNWDAELLRLLPAIIAAKTNEELSAVLEKRLDQLPQIPNCKSCSNKTKQQSLIKPNYGDLLTGKVFNQSLTNKISFILYNAQVKKNYYIAMAPGVGNPIFKNEKAYANMAYPDAGYRILALFRYWNMINYFFPYKDVIGEDWNQVLPEMLPVFIAAKDQTQYTKATLKLFAKINDTHAYAMGSADVVNNIRGKNTAPFRAKFVGDQLIVYDYFNAEDSIKKSYKIGDEILMINGEKVTDLIKKYDPFVAASNYDTKLRNLPLGFLLRSDDETMQLTIKREEQLIKQTCRLIDYKSTYNIKNPAVQSHKIISGNIGYVYPGSYKNASLPEITKLFENTKGIVVDMRCYPSDFMPFTFGNYIKKDKTPFVKFSMGSVAAPGTFRMGNEISNGGNNNAYKGKIIVIVNSESQSNAEYTTMAFQSSPNVKVIGSQTAGADGNVSTIVLPGGISSWISGIGVFYPDGTPTQRVGVKIDYPIKPTVKGIRDGKDELLEKAMELLKKGW